MGDVLTATRVRSLVVLTAAAALLLLMAAMLLAEARDDSLTTDESLYLVSGIAIAEHGVVAVEPTNPMGFQALGGLGVRLFGPAVDVPTSWQALERRCVYPADPAAFHRMIVAARIPAIGIALGLAMIVFLWARALFGSIAGLVSLSAVVFEPNVLGHGHLVTADAALALGLVGGIACYERWIKTGRGAWLVPCGVATGWALLSKVTGVEVFVILGLVGLLLARGRLVDRLAATARSIGIVAALAWSIVCLAYLPFRSAIADAAPPLADGTAFQAWPAPLSWVAPPPWIYSLRFQLGHAQAGHLAYLNGEVSDHGFWNYYLEVLAMKSTLGLLLLLVLAGVLVTWRRDRWIAAAVWLPIAIVVLVASLGGIDLGVRYVLPVFPLAAVAVGALAMTAVPLLRARVAVTGLLLVVAAGASLQQFPAHIGYTNLLAGQQPEQYLGDSNLAWGQDYWRLARWWDSQGRPPLAVRGLLIPPGDRYGLVVREVNDDNEVVSGLFATDILTLRTHPDLPAFRQLRGTTPVARVGTAIAVFDVHGQSGLVGPDRLPTPPPCPR